MESVLRKQNVFSIDASTVPKFSLLVILPEKRETVFQSFFLFASPTPRRSVKSILYFSSRVFYHKTLKLPAVMIKLSKK